MIYNNIDKLIAEAMKNKDNERLSTLRLVKTKFLEYKTSKGAKPIDETIEIQILRKMISERMDAMGIYLTANRQELADKEKKEIEIIKEFLPKEITEDQIAKAFNNVLKSGVEPIRKNMGIYIKNIKAELPMADGKAVSTFVSSRLS